MLTHQLLSKNSMWKSSKQYPTQLFNSPSSYYGTKSLLKSDFKREYVDSTLNKETIIKNLKEKKRLTLRTKHEVSIVKASEAKNRYNKFKKFCNDMMQSRKNNLNCEHYSLIMHKAALKIQKVFKGHLIRKKYSEVRSQLGNR